ncbi:MAG TPA: kelch repeat-containing protein [Candidatus Limnocylindria bacterium]|nr:kelch repeat-containing protein [Candidatus Limnocylindria bacterium]
MRCSRFFRSARSFLLSAVASLIVANSEVVADPQDGTWSEIPPVPRVWSHTAVHDPVRHRMLLFGGVAEGAGSSQVVLDQVWALSLSGSPAWTRIETQGSGPGRRSRHSAIYDPVRDRLIVYGGDSDILYDGLDDTAIYALTLSGTPTWTRIAPAGGPAGGRIGHTAIYDPIRDRMVVFGGSYSDECWALELAGEPTWTPIIATGSAGHRQAHSVIYDPVDDRMIVFGGWVTEIPGTSNDAWALSLAGAPAWQPILTSGLAPPARGGHQAIYDSSSHEMVIFGGGAPNPSNDVWSLSLGTTPTWRSWSPQDQSPEERQAHTVIYDPLGPRLVTYGGFGASYMINETWELSLGSAPAWGRFRVEGERPAGRESFTAAYDPARRRMVVFGGQNTNQVYGDLHALSLDDSPRWAPIATGGTSPAPRHSHTAVYDLNSDRLVIFGGDSEGSRNNDVWTLEPGTPPTWSQLSPGGVAPTPRRGYSAIYDELRDRMIVFGGDLSGGLSEIWELSLGPMPIWTQLLPQNSGPSGRFEHTAVYDGAGDRMIVFGGKFFVPATDNTTLLSDSWSLDLGSLTWSLVAPPGSGPAARIEHSAVFDPDRKRMLVHGGQPDFGAPYDDTWSLDLSGASGSWTRLESAGGFPGPRYRHAAVYDPRGGAMVVFAGNSAQDDTWRLVWDDVLTATVVSVARAEFVGDRVRLEWHFAQPVGTTSVQRCTPGRTWEDRGLVDVVGPDRVTHEDAEVVPGATYRYRLSWKEGGTHLTGGETEVAVPALARLGLSVHPNPARGRTAAVRFSLISDAPARLEAFDVRGRLLWSAEVGAEGPGTHEWRISSRDLSGMGLLFLRLTQDGRSVITRLAVVE